MSFGHKMRELVPKYDIITNNNSKKRFMNINNNNILIIKRNLSLYILLICSLCLISYVIYLCNYYDTNHIRLDPKYGPIAKTKSLNVKLWNTERDDTSDDYESQVIERTDRFDMTSDDVMVFLHIQNTGGNVFVRHIVDDLIIDSPCNCNANHRKRCLCLRPNKPHSQWLFSRLTVGTKCGIHPDFNELMHCTDRVLDELEGDSIKRRYFYITLLRDPITRFISEYNHFTTQEMSGKASRHWCGGKEVTQIPECDFNSDVSIDDYLKCGNNLAINRQTRMLSDLALVGCYNQSFMSKSERELVMLMSAKNNLHKMAFFGLNEFPRISQYLFEETFDIMFLDADTHYLHRNKRSILDDFSTKTIEQIKLINHLDMELYEYAKELLFDRFGKLKNKNPRLKNLSVSSVAKDNEDIVNWGDSEDKQST